jgi:catechol 2,3-dioxygenase-like lactoylglutathione lyase family enzyme
LPGAIHHAVVAVRDLDVSLRFYRDAAANDGEALPVARVVGIG